MTGTAFFLKCSGKNYILLIILFFCIYQPSFALSDTIVVEKKPIATNEYFTPGKFDYISTFNQKYLANNFIFWSKSMKVGFGEVYNGTILSHYGGGFFRPLAFTTSKNDLIVGANYYRPDFLHTFWDVQGEFRHEFGL